MVKEFREEKIEVLNPKKRGRTSKMERNGKKKSVKIQN